MKLHTPDGRELMEVVSLTREGDELIVRGVIMGTMPIKAVLAPEELRSATRLLSFKLVKDLLALWCKRGKTARQVSAA